MGVSKKTIGIAAGGIGVAILLAGGTTVVGKSYHGHGWHGYVFGDKAAHMEWMIDRIDANGDGSLSRTEVQSYRDSQFAVMDADSNGEITPKELSHGARALIFSRFDVDGDGMVSEQEFLSVSEGTGPMGRGFHFIDDNDNGRIEPQEISEMTDYMFSRIDDNGDGTINTDELEDMRGWRRH